MGVWKEKKVTPLAPKENELSKYEIENTVKVIEINNPHLRRRVTSELALEKELTWHFEKGISYHCFSWGDVDSLTYLRVIVKQQKLKLMSAMLCICVIGTGF